MKKVIVGIIFIGVLLAMISGGNKSTKETSGEIKSISATDISKFDYTIEAENLILKDYKGSGKYIIIPETYSIDGIDYTVTEIGHAIFNGCNATTIYLPKTLTCVYDDTLAYLNNAAEQIDLYFGGTEETWNGIFTKYEVANAKEKWNEGDAEGAGEALASKLNAKIGHEYDASKFIYHFEANIEDIVLD